MYCSIGKSRTDLGMEYQKNGVLYQKGNKQERDSNLREIIVLNLKWAIQLRIFD